MELRILQIPAACAAAVLAVTAACVGSASTASSPAAATPTPPPRQVPLSPELEQGKQLFFRAGCAGCHGSEAEFLIVVNLPEVSEAAVKAQVRKPTGMMAAFSEAALSDGDLDRIARFVVAVLFQR